MDAAHKLFKNLALLATIALLTATVGLAQATFTVSPSSAVTLFGSGGSQITLGSSGTDFGFTVGATQYGDSSGSWLNVSRSSVTTPAVITFSLAMAPTTGGTHTATVVMTPASGAPSSAQPVTITVTYSNGSPGSGGSGTLTATPNPVALSAALNNTSGNTAVTITNNTSALVTITNITTSTTNGVAWLSAAISNSFIQANSTVTLNVSGYAYSLTAGVYSGKVTLTPSSGTALDVNVNFTVGGGTGTGTWSLNPSSLAWSYNTNSANYPSQTVYPSTTSGSTTYNISTTTDSGGGWLSLYFPTVSGTAIYSSPQNYVPLANPFGLTVNSLANNLPTGTYTGHALISDSSFQQQVQLTVTLTVNGGSSTVLTATPNPVNFNVSVNGAQQSQTVTVYSGQGGTLSINPSLSSGLTYQLGNTSIAAGGSTTFTVYANPAGLAANTYSGTLYIYVGSQSVALPVNMYVGGGGSTGGTGTTAVAPTSLNFSYQLGTDPQNFVSRQKLAITGPAGSWSASASTANGIAWLKVSPSSGSSLPNPGDDNAAPIVTCDATGLTFGTYSGTVIVNTPGGSQSIAVSLSVGSSTVLLPTPGSLIFAANTGGAKPVGKIMYFSGSDSALNPLAIAATSNNSWISVTNDTNSMVVTVDQTGLTTGTYSGTVSVAQTGAANNPLVVPVVLVVNGGGSGGTGGNSNVTVSPNTLTFTTGAGASPNSQTISVTSASGTAGIAFTAQVTSGAWLSVTPNSGTTATTLTVSVASGSLASGSYTGNIQITPTGGSTFNVPVNLTVTTAPAVSASPTSLSFSYSAGGATPAAQSVTVSGNGSAYSATASSNGGWLAVSPATGTAPGTLSVTVNPAGLAANTYTGTITVAGASGATGSTTINVSLEVKATLPTITKLTNAASYATGSIAPGEIITLFAGDPAHPIGPATPAGLTLDSNGKVATTLGGVQVTVNGYLCPLIYVSATQVSAVVPYEVKLFANATVQVKYLGQSSNGISVTVATAVPGLFTLNSSGTGPGAILNSNGSTNTPTNPATRGDTVVVYLTGEGETSPAGVTGKVTTVATSGPLTPGPLLQVSVTIGGQAANWTFAGEAPGFVSGVMQLNVTVPTNISAGDQPILVNFGSTPSQLGVTVSVK